ncbi:hypothetical protein [Pseudomonas gingeri]|uniref:Polyhydroxyalkanoic acid system protein n=1 Tax=Pseudomonas gingeri TaxID=117681 RepID=A0A7Y7YJZ2_9PSED|nr:hypothetical protein [Pseudomonas gingeri]NWB32066.1 hypothetical protein [Pseudomonas gingeri]NWC37525.1 hypothetical protein [Pseudomonas gingeri]
MAENVVRINLGDEFDESLRAALRTVLAALGATNVDYSWGVGGSQELEVMTVCLNGHVLMVESETYIGLTVEGPEMVVRGLAEKVKQYLGRE